MSIDANKGENLTVRARSLIELVEPQFPVESPGLTPAAAWPIYGPALISRQTGALQALVQLSSLDRAADSLVVVRSLFDHAVTFAWLAADTGPERLLSFHKHDLIARRKAANDCEAIGVNLLSASARESMEAEIAGLDSVTQMPALADRATEADTYWEPRLEVLEPSARPRSYRGLYAAGYRRQSATAHASGMGLLRVLRDLPNGGRSVELGEPDTEYERPPLGMGTLMFALSLFVSAETLGWPDHRAVEAAFVGET